jgi:hypothetical protein
VGDRNPVMPIPNEVDITNIERNHFNVFKSIDNEDQVEFDHAVIEVQQLVPADQYALLWQQGCEMTLDQARDLARLVPDATASAEQL